jgi:hypothetical protein
MPEVSRPLSLAPSQILRLAAAPRASLHLQLRQGRLELLRPAWLAQGPLLLEPGQGWSLEAGEGPLWLRASGSAGAELLLWQEPARGLIERALAALRQAWRPLSAQGPLSATRTSRTD